MLSESAQDHSRIENVVVRIHARRREVTSTGLLSQEHIYVADGAGTGTGSVLRPRIRPKRREWSQLAQ
jgi:hypothetical protein